MESICFLDLQERLDKIINNIRYLRVPQEGKVLMVGSEGCGKTSLGNTVQAALLGRCVKSAHHGHTKQMQARRIHVRKGSHRTPTGIELVDVPAKMTPRSEKEFQRLLEKRLSNTSKETPRETPSPQLITPRETPTPTPTPTDNKRHNSAVHGIILVIDGSQTFDEDTKDLYVKINALARHKGIPVRALVTKVDCMDPCVSANLQYVFHSKEVRALCRGISSVLDMNLCHIFPVKNYTQETATDTTVDLLTVAAFENVMESVVSHMLDKENVML